MNKKLLIPIALFGLMISVGAYGVANAEESRLPIVERLAERFDLDVNEVQEFFSEFKKERTIEHKVKGEGKLDQLVEDGVITEEQKQALLERKEEIKEQREGLKSLSPEERREAMNQAHEEMKAWMKENGIDLGEFGKGEARPPKKRMGK